MSALNQYIINHFLLWSNGFKIVNSLLLNLTMYLLFYRKKRPRRLSAKQDANDAQKRERRENEKRKKKRKRRRRKKKKKRRKRKGNGSLTKKRSLEIVVSNQFIIIDFSFFTISTKY